MDGGGRARPFVSQVKEAAEKVEEKTDLTVTVFEIETAIAFLYFREKQCDYVVLEAGMGGLLDATNVIDTTVLSILHRSVWIISECWETH